MTQPKGINDKMPQPWSPSAEKLEKKAVFLPYCGDEESDADGPHHGDFHHTAEMKRHILWMGFICLEFQERKRRPFAAARFWGKFFRGAGLFGLDG